MALPSLASRAPLLAPIAAHRRTLAGVVVVALVLTSRRSVAQPGTVSFDCLTLLPTGRYLSEAQSLVSPCPIAISVGRNYADGARYTPGQTVRVQFRVADRASVSAFFCRSSQVLLATPVGVWNVSDAAFLSSFDCLKDADALVASDFGGGGGTVFDAFWTPPVTGGLGDMEIVCSVLSDDGDFWIWNSFMISESRSVNGIPSGGDRL